MRNAAREIAPPDLSPPPPLRRAVADLWPLLVLVLLQAAAIVQIGAVSGLQSTALSATVAGVILAIGLLPVAVRPAGPSTTFACFSVVMASLVFLTPQPLDWDPAYLLTTPVAPQALLLIANWMLLGMFGQQLAMRFTGMGALSRRASAGAFALALAGLLGLVFAPPGALRLIALITLTVFALGLIAFGGWLMLRATQTISDTAIAARVVLVSVVIAELPFVAAILSRSTGVEIPSDLIRGSQVLIPLGIAGAILQHNPFGIDTVVRRALAFMGVAVALLVVHLSIALGLVAVLQLIEPPFRGLAIVGGLLLGGILYTPVRVATEEAIQRVTFPERRTLAREVDAAQAALARVVRREAVIALLTAELPARIDAEWAAITGPDEPAPDRPLLDRAWSAPLQVGDRLLGRYWLSQRRYCRSYAPEERERLAALARQAALTLAYAETVEALTQVNAELEERVEARSVQVLAQQRELVAIEERQRLARDLHDSVKQSLFSLGLGLRAVRGMLQSDPAAALSALREQEQVVAQAQAEMGDLLDQLRAQPAPAGDLAAALRSYAALVQQRSGVAISVAAPPALRLADVVAGELLQIAREALHNAVKHSGAAAAHVGLTLAGRELRLVVTDQGRGFDVARVRGGQGGHYGLRGIAERAAAVGGALDIHSAPGQGTAVEVMIRVDGHAE